LSTVVLKDLCDDVQVLAGTNAVWNIAAGEVEIMVGDICELEAQAMCRIWIVISSVNHESFNGGVIRLWALDEGTELLVVVDCDIWHTGCGGRCIGCLTGLLGQGVEANNYWGVRGECVTGGE